MKSTQETLEKALQANRNGEQLISQFDTKEKIPTITLWCDLLGYSQHIDTALGTKRLATFHEVSLEMMNKQHTIVQINDATVVSLDLPSGSEKEILTNFLAQMDYFFEVAHFADTNIGGFGIRGVISMGHRNKLRANLGWSDMHDNLNNPSFFCPAPIMMNTAFAKSYFADNSGILIKKSSLYIESSIINNYTPTIIETWKIHDKIQIGNLGEYLLVRKETE